MDFFKKLKSEPLVDKDNKSSVVSLQWNSTGTRIAYSKTDRSLKVWRRGHDKCTDLITISECHARPIESISWDPVNEYRFVTVGKDEKIKLWEVSHSNQNHKLVRTLHVSSRAININVAFSPDGRFLAVVDKSNKVTLFDVAAGFSKLVTFPFRETIYDLCWSNVSHFFFLALGDGSVPVVEVNYDPGNAVPVSLNVISRLVGSQSPATCVKMDPLGKYIAVASHEGVVSLWDADSLICVKVFSGLDYPIASCDFSKDGTYIAISYEYGAEGARIFDIDKMSEEWDIKSCISKDGMNLSQVKFCPNKMNIVHTTENGFGCNVLYKGVEEKRRRR